MNNQENNPKEDNRSVEEPLFMEEREPADRKRIMEKKKSFRSGFITALLAVALISTVIIVACEGWKLKNRAGAYAAAAPEETSVSANSAATEDTLNKLRLLETTINDYYLEGSDTEALENGIYSGLVEALGDPYSVYYSSEELAELRMKTEGVYYGVGAYVQIDTNTNLPMLSGIIEGTPAQEAGLRAGDLIYKVDNEEVQGLELTQVVSRIKGPEGTAVHLSIIREGETDYMEFEVLRRKVESPTVTQKMLDNNIGYIQIKEFDTITLDQFTEALAVCRGSGMQGLILDLRSNPGGNLDTVCDISRQILPEGLIVYTEDKNGNRDEYTCDGKNQLDVPLVVLVDSNSASASEILAGAVKDYGVGTLVGTTTFGKGIVQRIINLSDGSAVKLTVSKYYTPNGNNIHKIGIAPDVEVKFDADAYYNDNIDNQLNKAVEVMNEKLNAQ